ncbi:RNA polymerase recycling motor ATPase HelR [Rhodococcus sp. NBC_00297]|uniref:RNA polymerase recycling motor ATPase HelR n=1 Tax=Rhodococcus sp. NBC_00297 TaxID=2976005 RepID=UPI002E295BF1|nr:RNA polymerase recycling motor ATPase HelR [Rhodococcus sp. NBC_00297]
MDTVFTLPPHRRAKADPASIAADDRHLARIDAALRSSLADLEQRLARTRTDPGRSGQDAMERDLETHRLTAEIRAVRRVGQDMCLGRLVPADGTAPVYIGRRGLLDDTGRPLLIDWRSPAAAPFFAATPARPMGIAWRRRYRWTAGRVSDYWDEVFTAEIPVGAVALDDRSAFVADLGAARSSRMRDVLGTIAADQDAIVRAPSRGVRVVDGGPGTGKSIVALHRAAYLLYADPQVGHHRGGVLVIGPHEPYLSYVADVLPDLGEDGVRVCLLDEMVPEGRKAVAESSPRAAAVKGSAAMVEMIDRAIRFYETPPATDMVVDTEWGAVLLRAADWAEAFAAPDAATPHNDAREEIWAALGDTVVDRLAADVSATDLASSLREIDELRDRVESSWTVIDAPDLVADLWAVPAYLRHCAPWLDEDDRAAVRRDLGAPWTTADLPLLDVARRRLGDPKASALRERRVRVVASERARRRAVIDDLVASDDSELRVMSMLRGDDLQNTLDDIDSSTVEPDRLGGPFSHIVVDEAQELTDAQWQMVRARCPSGSLTVVGDRAQAHRGFPEPWQERLTRVGFTEIAVSTLDVNYRTPSEIMAEAEPVIRAVLPDANVPRSVRSTGVSVRHAGIDDLDAIVDEWAATSEGVACVIGMPSLPDTRRIRSLSARSAKGLEFDLVVLVDRPGIDPTGVDRAVDRYVAMTRATQRLVVLK